MGIPKKKKQFIRHNWDRMSVEALSKQTGIDVDTIKSLARELNREPQGAKMPQPEVDSPGGTLKAYLLPALILPLIAFIIYSNTLNGEFVFDDVIIRDNPSLHVANISQVFDLLTQEGISRRIGMLSFAVNFLFSGMDPTGYRITNIVIHILTGYCLFLLLYWTFTRTAVTGISGRNAFACSFAGTVLWLVHPLQIQAVTYVIQRFTSLASLFMLVSLLFYIRGRLSPSGWKYIFFVLSCAAGLLALGSKQIAGALPGIILLYEICFFGRIRVTFNVRTARYLGVAILISIIISGIYLWKPETTLMERFAERDITPVQRVLTEARVLVYYMTLAVYPKPSRLNVDYDFPKSTGLFRPPTTFFSLLLIAGLLFLGVYLVVRNHVFPGFSILWFLGTLVIESTIIPLDLVYEHRLYMPTMMPIALFVSAIFSIRPQHWRLAGYVVYGAIVVLFSWWTYQRNFVWTDAVTLWEDNLRKSPNKARVHGNLGKAYLERGQNEKALEHFEEVIKLDPRLLGAYDNIATIYINHYRDYDRAREYLLQALSRNPGYPSPYLNLGVIHLRLKQVPEAIQNFEKVLQLDPENALGHFNLAAAYFNLGDFDRAESILLKGLSIWPRNDQLYGLLGVTYYEKDNLSLAETSLRKAISINPGNSMARLYLQKMYGNNK